MDEILLIKEDMKQKGKKLKLQTKVKLKKLLRLEMRKLK
jgi:hypothetical protein